jgi:hypothetical protein
LDTKDSPELCQNESGQTDDGSTPLGEGLPVFPRTERYSYQGLLGLWVLQIQFHSPHSVDVIYTSPAPENTNYTQSLVVSSLIEVGRECVKWVGYLEELLQQQRSSTEEEAAVQQPSSSPQFRYCGNQLAGGAVEIGGRRSLVKAIQPGQIVVLCEEVHSQHPALLYVKPLSGADNWQGGIAVRQEDLEPVVD